MNEAPPQTPSAASGFSEDAVAPLIQKTTMDVNEIMAVLPHRYPFLMIDRVVDMEWRKRVVAIKNVSVNEPFFQGHFPAYPLLPGVMTVEAMAQAGGALLLTEIPNRHEKLMVFTGIEEARFRRPVVPGDQLRIEVTVLNWRSRAVKMKGVCTVEGKVVADAIITCQIVPRERKTREDAETKPAESADAAQTGTAAE